MTDPIALLRPRSIDAAARELNLHPFEVVRLLALIGELPDDLRIDGALIQRIRDVGGLQTWWLEDPTEGTTEAREATLVRALVERLLSWQLVEPAVTRADNMFRGLGAEAQKILRRSVNLLIREGYLVTHMVTSGLVVSVRAGSVDDFRRFAEEGTGPVADLLERG